MPINNDFNKTIKENNYKNIWEKQKFNQKTINKINDENINWLNKSLKSPTIRGTCRDWKEEINRDNYSDWGSPLPIPTPIFCY